MRAITWLMIAIALLASCVDADDTEVVYVPVDDGASGAADETYLQYAGPDTSRSVSYLSESKWDGWEDSPERVKAAGCNTVGVDVKDADFELPEGTGLAYNVIHGTFGEDGQLQSLLESRGIPYTGAGVASSRTAFAKNLAKEKFIAAGVPTPA